MQSIRFTQAWSPAFLGAGRPLLGQVPALPAILPQAESVQDIPQAVSADQWAAQPWTKDEAEAAFNVANLLWTVREKVAFSAVTFQKLVADPTLLGAVVKTPEGAAFVDVVSTLIRLSKQLSLPNLMSSVRNLLIALEVRVLLPKFGVGVQGRRAIFRGPDWPKPNILDYTDIKPGQGAKEILDFGDLSSTALSTDVKALRASVEKADEIAPGVSLSGPALAPIAVFLIKFAAWVVGALLVGRVVIYPIVSKIAEIVNPVIGNPDLLKIIQGMEPQKAQAMLINLSQNQKIWADAGVKIAMWIAIGLGALAVGWVATTVISSASKK